MMSHAGDALANVSHVLLIDTAPLWERTAPMVSAAISIATTVQRTFRLKEVLLLDSVFVAVPPPCRQILL